MTVFLELLGKGDAFVEKSIRAHVIIIISIVEIAQVVQRTDIYIGLDSVVNVILQTVHHDGVAHQGTVAVETLAQKQTAHRHQPLVVKPLPSAIELGRVHQIGTTDTHGQQREKQR